MSKLLDRLLRRKPTTPPAPAHDHVPAARDDATPAVSAAAVTLALAPLPAPSAPEPVDSVAPVISETPSTSAPNAIHTDPEPLEVSVLDVQETLAELALPVPLLAESGLQSATVPQPAPDTAFNLPGDAEIEDTDDLELDDEPPPAPAPTATTRGHARRRDAAGDETEGDNWAPSTPPGRPLKRNEVPAAETQLYVWDRDDEGDIVIRMEGSCVGTQWYGPTLYYLVIDWNDRHAPQNSARVVVDASHLRVAIAEKAPRTARATATTARKSRSAGDDEHTQRELES